jgi:hypothetical protein
MIVGEGPIAVAEQVAVVIPTVADAVDIRDTMGFVVVVLVCAFMRDLREPVADCIFSSSVAHTFNWDNCLFIDGGCRREKRSVRLIKESYDA